MKRQLRSIYRLLTALCACALLFGLVACQVGPQPPDEPIRDSGSDSTTLSDIWESAVLTGEGQVALVFTEHQLTTFVADRISQSESPLLDQARIYLRNGEISIYGVAELGPIEAGSLVVVQPIVDPEGTIAFEIASAKLGPLPAPSALLGALSDLLTEAFTGKLGPLATGIRITSLAIADGQVAIVGSLR